MEKLIKNIILLVAIPVIALFGYVTSVALSWNTAFNIGQGGTATSTAQTGGIFFYDGVTYTQDLTNLFWDKTNNRLAIGTTTPYAKLTLWEEAGEPIFEAVDTASTTVFSIDNSGYLATNGTTTNATSTTFSVSSYVDLMGEKFTNFTTYVRSLFTGGSHITITAGSIAVDDAFLLNNGDTGTGTYDFSGATMKLHTYPAFTYATSTAWTGTTTIPIGVAYNAEQWDGVKCFTDVGTLNVVFNDGTNDMDLLNASTTVGSFSLTTNNTFTASEKRYVEIGTPVTAPTKISCTVDKIVNN